MSCVLLLTLTLSPLPAADEPARYQGRTAQEWGPVFVFDRDPDVVRHAAEALSRLEPECLPWFARGISKGGPDARRWGLEALSNRAGKLDALTVREAFPGLLACLQDREIEQFGSGATRVVDVDRAVKIVGGGVEQVALEDLRKALPELQRLAKSRHAQLRKDATVALKKALAAAQK